MYKPAHMYYEEYKTLQKKIEGLDNKITERLLLLGETHPNAIITIIDGIEIKSNVLIRYKKFINKYSIEKRIEFMCNIEKWLTEQKSNRQLEMF